MFGFLIKLSSVNKSFTIESAGEKLGEEFTKKLLSEKENLRLDYSFENLFDKCNLANELLEEKKRIKDETRLGLSSKKVVSGENKLVQDLSACVIRKFNAYEISSVKIKREQKIFSLPS